MMIDDDFITYSKSIETLLSGGKIDERKANGSKRAAALERFFQDKNMLCIIDDGVGNFDVERIRKSDLIIIDYHLEDNSPSKTLDILDKLRSSDQLNMIVVYTQEDLNKVWKQISSTFKGNLKIDDIVANTNEYEFIEYWEDIIKPDLDNNGVLSLSENEIISYINTNEIARRLRRELFNKEGFSQSEILKANLCILTRLISEYCISKYNVTNRIKGDNESSDLQGCCDEYKWIKSGNVFITLYSKGRDVEDNDASEIWQRLNTSLHQWHPSYYSIIKSEIQNKIESEALSFNIHLANDLFGQAAWLNEIIKTEDIETKNDKIEVIFKNISEELYFKLKDSENLRLFIDSVFEHYKSDFLQGNAQENIDKKRIKYCALSMGLPDNDNCHRDMYHALNMNLSSRNYNEKYISTGTVLFDSLKNEWYLCVSAACDMVPSQGNDLYHKRLNPHRLIKVMKLFSVSADVALNEAHHSKYVYAFEKDAREHRKYFSVTNPNTLLPQIDYMVVLNHTNQMRKKYIDVLVLRSDNDGVIQEKINLKLKSQLRSGYAERYQHIASQYGGRIGVDYVGLGIVQSDVP